MLCGSRGRNRTSSIAAVTIELKGSTWNEVILGNEVGTPVTHLASDSITGLALLLLVVALLLITYSSSLTNHSTHAQLSNVVRVWCIQTSKVLKLDFLFLIFTYECSLPSIFDVIIHSNNGWTVKRTTKRRWLLGWSEILDKLSWGSDVFSSHQLFKRLCYITRYLLFLIE